MPSAVAHVALSTALPLRSMAESAVKVRHCRWLASTVTAVIWRTVLPSSYPSISKREKHRTAEWMNFQSPAVETSSTFNTPFKRVLSDR